jgi:hypothetical protein
MAWRAQPHVVAVKNTRVGEDDVVILLPAMTGRGPRRLVGLATVLARIAPPMTKPKGGDREVDLPRLREGGISCKAGPALGAVPSRRIGSR